MNSNLLFDFTVDRDNKTIHVKREFAAELPMVWDAWTRPALLDLWWAPKPYQTETKTMDFRVGGFWLYAMRSPTGDEHWCRADYKSIHLQQSFSWVDAFCDADGNITSNLPDAHWDTEFASTGNTTTVNVVLRYKTIEQLEQIIQMGFREGFTMALSNLDQYIEAQFRLRQQFRQGTAARVCTYLNFPGTTEEAFLFYQSVFNTEFSGGGIQRFGDLPADANHPPVADAVKKMVLHVELPITAGHILMGTDAPAEMGFTLTPGNNMHISLEPETRTEAKRIFDSLSAGGTISMPLQDMFWGAYFGSFTDKYGINWMINCQSKQ